VIEKQAAPIDEPVTTDTRRLIRLPGTLHGGTGFVVRRIERDALDDFDPLEDAVPARFREREIAVECDAASTVELLGDSFNIQAGHSSVLEAVGVLLMARGDARKVPER